MTVESEGAVLQAAQRVGSRPDEQFAWLYTFTARDRPMTEQQIEEIRLEMLAFVGMGPWTGHAPEHSLVGLDSPDASETVLAIYEGVRAGFDGLKRTNVFTLPRRIIDGVERRAAAIDGVAWREGSSMVPVSNGTPDQRFFGAVVALLVDIGPRLRTCDNPKCERLFLTEGRTRYCRKACSQQVRTEKYRASHPTEVSDWRHAEYERRQRKKHRNPRLQVTRRGRATKLRPSKARKRS